MIDRVTPPNNPQETPTVSQLRPAAPKGSEFTLESVQTLEGGVPAKPPTEVLYALDRAQSVIAELASRQVSMKISVDEETSKIRVALYDSDGKLIREVPNSHATGMLSGERPVGWLSK